MAEQESRPTLRPEPKKSEGSTELRGLGQTICGECHGAGFIEGSYMKDNQTHASITPCRACGNLAGYSSEIKRRFGDQLASETPQQRTNRILGR